MQTIYLKRNINFYFNITIGVVLTLLFFFLIGILLLDIHELSVKNWIALIVLFLATYGYFNFIRTNFQHTPTIYLDTQNIQFNTNEVYSVQSIINLNLDYTSFWIIRGIVVVPFPSIYIKFDNHVEKIIPVDYYNDIHFLKQALEQLHFLKSSTIELKSIDLPSDVEISTPTTKIYPSLWFFNLRVILILIPILFLSFISVAAMDTTQIGWIILNIMILWLIFLLLVLIKRTQYYFEINKEYLVVRNVLQFWKKHIYPLKDIKYLQIIEDSRTPKGLRITLNSFATYQYFASSYSDKLWKQLESTLQQYKVKIK